MAARQFNSEDGLTWIARIHDGLDHAAREQRAGWEVVQFDGGAVQRIIYRPAGWLAGASIEELIAALREGEAVRARWK
jgi:hypothetical protein